MQIPTSDPSPGTAELAYLSAGELRARYADGTLETLAVIANVRDRVGGLNRGGATDLRAVIDLDDGVVDRAGEIAERGVDGLLGGVPIAVKDNVEVAGWISGAGSEIFTEPASTDAPLVSSLRAAGAVLVANCNMTEWASSSSGAIEEGWSSRGGVVGNPWALDRSAGGSSSGSAAAIAAGIVPVAIGTETVGSLTQPASYCGVYSMKVTRGLVSNDGIVPFSRAQDVPGVFTRTLADLQLVMSVLTGEDLDVADDVAIGILHDEDLNDPQQTPGKLRDDYVDLWWSWGNATSDPRSIERIDPDLFDGMWQLLFAELNRDLTAYLRARPGSPCQSLGELVEVLERLDGVRGSSTSPIPRNLLRMAAERDPSHVEVDRQEVERAFGTYMDGLMGNDDVVVAPAYGPAPKLDLQRGFRSQGGNYQSCLDAVSSVLGWPAIVAPFTRVGGLPVGLIFVARPHMEAKLLAAATQLDVGFSPPSWTPPSRG